jgi:23S rRNA pseudouridine1911/1915/1917 synthase
LFVVHRIDKETSGVVAFARSWVAKRHLARLFRDHDIEREYLAIAAGHLSRDRMTYESHLVENRGDGLRGSAKQRGLGVRAVTHVEVIARLGAHGDAPDAATLVRCRLETGRTHQIRIHLAEHGHPLLGDRVYSRHYQGPFYAVPRMMLHARSIGFAHPAETARRVEVAVEPPADFLDVLAALGWRATSSEERAAQKSRNPRLP